jgi:hypothetical protein
VQASGFNDPNSFRGSVISLTAQLLCWQDMINPENRKCCFQSIHYASSWYNADLLLPLGVQTEKSIQSLSSISTKPWACGTQQRGIRFQGEALLFSPLKNGHSISSTPLGFSPEHLSTRPRTMRMPMNLWFVMLGFRTRCEEFLETMMKTTAIAYGVEIFII